MSSMLSSGPSGPSGGGSSAPVIEFICLFTHDLRRKQKRWEDGRLKYHTFNKRVMVHDERGHFVGDMHWRRDWDFDEGEEVQLERGGVLVQVVECVGRQEQDLTELLDKRVKEREQRQARVAVRPSLPGPSPNTPLAGARMNDHFQTRHRPLNQLLGTPTGHHGRAVVPTESPFELRQRVNETPDDRTNPPPPKRRKCDITPLSKMGYAQNLFGATLSLSAVPVSSAPPRRPTVPGAAYRPQPETSSPPEEATPDVRPPGGSGEGGGRIGLQGVPSRARVVAPPPRTSVEPDSSAVLEGQEPLEGAPRPLAPSRPEKTVPDRGTTSVQRSVGIGQHRPAPLSNIRPPTAAGRPTIASAMPEIGTETVAQDCRSAPVTKRIERNRSARGTVAPSLGVSRSQAIALDEDEDHRPDARGQVSERQETAEETGSTRASASTVKRKPAKRSTLPKPAAQVPVVESTTTAARTSAEEPPEEERTELRLKPRQKRGLLMLSEKRSKPKQPKRQAVPPNEEPSREFRKRPANVAIGEPSLALDAETADDPCPAAQQHNPSASSPAAPGRSIREPGSLSPRQTRPRSESTDSIPPNAAAHLSEQEEIGVDQPASPKSPEPAYGDSDKAKDGTVILSSSPSPRARRVRPRRGAAAKTREEPRETSSLDPEGSSADAAPEPPRSRPPRQTRKKKNQDGQDSGRSKKKVRRADSGDSDSEELPKAPARPRLAKLSKKSVRSREVFGFVPSSSPITNVNLLRPSFGARGPDPSEDDAAAAGCLADPTSETFPVSNEAQPFLEEDQISSPPIGLSRAAPLALQPPNSFSSDAEGEEMIRESEQKRAAASTTPQSDDPLSRRHSTGYHTSAISPPGSERGSNKTTLVSVPGPESIAAPEKETTPATARPNREKLPAVESMTLRSQLHNLLEQPEHPMNDSSDIGPDSCVTESAKDDPPVARTAEASRPRITNPATRGRKAALKSHAAGQVPLSIISADPVPVRVVVGVQPPRTMARPDPAASERPKRTMRFPGFASAKGAGPWSREAHDLLESARPC